MTELLLGAFVFLAAAVVAIPIASRLGLGSVLGYLVAGVIIGPVLGLTGVQESVQIQHYAEFGVVMMLFLVGLELEPAALWRMRTRLLGLGGLQVLATTALFTGLAMQFSLDWRTALAIGSLLSLSSTAIVLQTFQEKGLVRSEGARSAFSVLLFQDIAVIPMLALLPLLALPELTAGSTVAQDSGHHEMSLVADLSGWMYAAVVIGCVVLLVVAGRYLSRPLFHIIAATRIREAFTACALMLVIGIALLMSLIGLSPALGTFLAGVVLANSEFRHELETDIEPFKGLLLGLFFLTVGASVQFGVLIENALLVVSLTLAVILAKGVVLAGLALLFKVRGSDGWLFTLSLAQAGEFGFVLINYAAQNRVLLPELVPVLSLVVALSMFLTPMLFIIFDRVILPRYQHAEEAGGSDEIDERGSVIIAGSGRFGQIVTRMLRASQITTVVLDRSPQQVQNMRSVGIKSYFGDASRPDLLDTAGVADAALVVVAIDQPDEAVALTKYLKQCYPGLPLLARAYDRGHLYALRESGADWVVSETYYSALALATESLERLGVHPFRARQLQGVFDDAEAHGRDLLYEHWRQKNEGERYGRGFQSLYIELEETLHKLMQRDRDDEHERGERGWKPPPRPS